MPPGPDPDPLHAGSAGPRPALLFTAGSLAQTSMVAAAAPHLSAFRLVALVVNFNDPSRTAAAARAAGFETLDGIYLTRGKARRILRRLAPRALVVGHDQNARQKILLRECRRLGIPSVLVQDGLQLERATGMEGLVRGSRVGRMLKRLASASSSAEALVRAKAYAFELTHGLRLRGGVYGAGGCTRVCVFGERDRRRLLEAGVPEETIVVTGNPKFDLAGAVRARRPAVPAWRGNVGVLTQPFVELGMWTPEQREAFVRAVAGAARAAGGRATFRPHPSLEDPRVYERLVADAGLDAAVDVQGRLPEAFLPWDAAVTVSSTAGLEAVVCGVPLVVYDPFRTPGAELLAQAAAAVAATPDDLAAALRRIAADPAAPSGSSEFVRESIHLGEEPAAVAIARVVRELAGAPRAPGGA